MGEQRVPKPHPLQLAAVGPLPALRMGRMVNVPVRHLCGAAAEYRGLRRYVTRYKAGVCVRIVKMYRCPVCRFTAVGIDGDVFEGAPCFGVDEPKPARVKPTVGARNEAEAQLFRNNYPSAAADLRRRFKGR